MRKWIHRIRKGLIIPVICCSMAVGAHTYTVFAAATYYNSVERQTVTKGLTYEKSSRVTDAGLLDVHVMKMDMDSPHLSLLTIKSKTENGLKETTQKLVNDHGAIAGVNGDFFGVSGKYSVPMGAEVAGGRLLSINEASNAAGNGNATFFISANNVPFIDYMRTEVHFLNDGHENLKVNNVNKVFDLGIPSIVTTAAMATTKDIDARVPEAVKLVCEDEKITYISQRGETVTIPPNGYVVVMNGITANEKLSFFKVGQRAEFYLRPSLDIAAIQNAITGAGKILTAGQIANDGGVVVGGRVPRTAIGITQDKKQVILMTVDGRSHSVGANQTDMAQLMLEYGAYEAMHLDGGGSATMAVSENGAAAQVVNTLSEGSQRKVINALGVFNSAPVGDIQTLVVETPSEYILNRSSVKVTAYGLDAYNHRIELAPETLTFAASEGGGAFLDGYFTPATTGPIVLTASYGGLTGYTTVYSEEIAGILLKQNEIKTAAGGSAELGFSGITKNGRNVSLDSVSVLYEVVPADLGTVVGGVFTASRAGSGYIKCSLGEVSSYVPVYATLSTGMISDLENRPNVMGFGYPATAKGVLKYTNEQVTSGATAISLTYTFPASTETQAAYAMFEPKIQIPGKAVSLKLSVFGDQSNHWLRGKIFDATGKDYTIDFAKRIDWAGWKEVTAQIPVEATYPISLERIYVAALSETEETAHTIYFDDIKGLFEGDAPVIETPENTAFADHLSYTADNAPAGEFDITFMPSIYYTNGIDDTKPEGYLTTRKQAMDFLFKNSSRSIYLHNEDFKEEAGKQIKYNNGQYTVETLNSVLLIGMNAQNGGFMQSDVSQWGRIKNDITQSPAANVVIYTNATPLRFTQQKEFELFHELLTECQKTGKTIFVVSNEWINNSTDMIDGIRYINLGRMYLPDGSLNDDFSVLRCRVNGNDMKYCIDKFAK